MIYLFTIKWCEDSDILYGDYYHKVDNNDTVYVVDVMGDIFDMNIDTGESEYNYDIDISYKDITDKNYKCNVYTHKELQKIIHNEIMNKILESI